MGTINHKYKGIEGIKNISKEFGVSVSMIQKRMRQGMTLAEAVEMPTREKTIHVYKDAKGLEQISKLTGIAVHILKYRINKMGMTIKQAVRDAKTDGIDRPVQPEQVQIEFVKSSLCPKPHYSPLKALALGLITRDQYDEATKQ